MIDQFAQNVVDGLNNHQPQDPWATRIVNESGVRAWVKIYKRRWCLNNQNIFCWVQIECVNEGQDGNPPFRILLAHVRPGRHRWEQEHVHFGDSTDPADEKAVQQCVKFAENHIRDIEEKIPGEHMAPAATEKELQPESASPGEKNREDEGDGMTAAPVPVRVPPWPPVLTGKNAAERPKGEENPCEGIGPLVVQVGLHSVTASIGGVNFVVNVPNGEAGGQVHHHELHSLLTTHCTCYYGNGSWAAPYWCIGIEPRIDPGDMVPEIVPAPANDDSALLLKCVACVLTSRILLDDGLTNVRDYHQRFNGNLDVFEQPQRYWDTFISVVLGQNFPQNVPVAPAVVNAYRIADFLQPTGGTLNLDVLPLPSPTVNNWPAYGLLGIPPLANRPVYEGTYRAVRSAFIGNAIVGHNPELVFFLGMRNQAIANHILALIRAITGLNLAFTEYRWVIDRTKRILRADIRILDHTVKMCVAPQQRFGPPDLFYHHLSHFLFNGAPLFTQAVVE